MSAAMPFVWDPELVSIGVEEVVGRTEERVLVSACGRAGVLKVSRAGAASAEGVADTPRE